MDIGGNKDRLVELNQVLTWRGCLEAEFVACFVVVVVVNAEDEVNH